MKQQIFSLLAVAFVTQSCVGATPTPVATSTAPVTTDVTTPSVISTAESNTPTDFPQTTTKASVPTATTEKIETTTKRIYDCSKGAGQYPSPYSCSQFYVCVQTYIPAYVFDCPENLWYDPKLQQCNYPQLVDCSLVNIRRSSSFVVKINAKNETTDQGTTSFTTASISTKTSNPVTVTNVPTTPKDIPVTITTEKIETTTRKAYDCSKGEGQYPSPYSCAQYYVCVQTYVPAYVFDCPANLWYDPSLQQCNYSELVDCHVKN